MAIAVLRQKVIAVKTIHPKCAKCDLFLEGPADPQPHDMLRCPGCGQRETLENVVAEVGDYIRERVAESLGAIINGTARGSKFIKVTTRQLPQKDYRFIADYESDRNI